MSEMPAKRLALLGWLVAAGLAVALALVWRSGEARIAALKAETDVRLASAGRELGVCQAESQALKASVEVLRPGTAQGLLSPDAILARASRGADACARALEAEALVREAVR